MEKRGFEFLLAVHKSYKRGDGQSKTHWSILVIEVPEEFQGTVMRSLGRERLR